MKHSSKRDFPVEHARRILEPGPIVLVSSCYKDERDVMTMGWHTVMEFTPSLIGCIIASSNHSFELIRKSKECVINVPSADLVDTVIAIGNSSGDEIDKFEVYDLATAKAAKVKAPLLKQCFASFECKLHDAKLVSTYNFFIFEIVKAHVAATPKHPKTLHYNGQGVFSVPGKLVDKHKQFTRLKGQPNF